LTAIAGAGMLGFSVALNALSDHAACTVIFMVVAAVLNFGISLLQTLDKIAWIGWFGLFGIMSSGESFRMQIFRKGLLISSPSRALSNHPRYRGVLARPAWRCSSNWPMEQGHPKFRQPDLLGSHGGCVDCSL
jgi:hypothetical protein